MAVNVAGLARLRALAKSQKFRDVAAAGGGALVGGTTGVMANSAMSPTKSDKNNEGNLSGTNGDPAASGSQVTPPEGVKSPTPAEIKTQVETPPLKGAGETDYMKDIRALLEGLDPIQARALERNVAAQIALTRETERTALAKSRELSARQIELENIKAWRGITEAQINREAQMALGLADVAYRATQANPATLAGLAPIAKLGAEAFK